MRVVSFLPTGTEMIYALGLGRSLVGRSQHCSYPPAVKSKPVVVFSRVKKIARQDSLEIHRAVLKLREQGVHQFEIDLSTLKRLKPDLVITQTLCSVCAAPHAEVSASLQILSPRPRVVTLRAQRFDEVFSELKELGSLTNQEAAALRLIRRLQERLELVQLKVASATPPRVWCCEWIEPLMAAGHWIPEVVECAGGLDSLGPKGKDSAWLNWEQVRAYDPDLILVMPCSYTIPQILREKDRLTQRPGWNRLTAVRRGRVFAVEGSLFHHAGPRLVEAVELLAHLFHPDRVPTAPRRRFRSF